jgi:hypothetical protein
MIDKTTFAMSDNIYFMKSKLLVAPDDETYALLRVPQYALIIDVILFIPTAYVAGAPVLSIGWLGNSQSAQTGGFIPSDLTRPWETGIKYSADATLVSTRSKYFNTKGGLITATIAAGGASTEGSFQVFAHYCIIQ